MGILVSWILGVFKIFLLCQSLATHRGFLRSGRERGIRTPGGVTLNGFQDRRFQPLSHLPNLEINSRTNSISYTNLQHYIVVKRLEATLGVEPRNQSFAGFCLTTWLCRRAKKYKAC